MLTAGDDSWGWASNRRNRSRRARLSRAVRERTASCCLCRSCSPSSGVGHIRSRQSSNVEGWQRTTPAGDGLSSDDGATVQLSSEGLRGSSQGARKRNNGRDWSGDAEASAHLLRGSQIRSSLRSLAASWDLTRLTRTTASVLILNRPTRTSTDVPRIGTWSRVVVDLPPESGPDLQAIAAACSLVA